MLYDAYGGVLTSTLSPTLTGVLLGQGAAGPDADLVYLGRGRYFDPLLGLPLQPNPLGGAPTVPQSLNRYAATSLGAPGVAEGTSQDSLFPILSTVGLNGVSTGAGMSLTAYATRLVGQLYIQANNALLKRAGYQNLFAQIGGTGRGIQYHSQPVIPAEGRTYKVLNSDQVIDLNALEAQAKKGWPVSYPKSDPFVPLNDTGLKQWLRSPGGEFSANFVLNMALAIPDLAAPWQDPYFRPWQSGVQNTVTGFGVLAGTALSIKVGAATLPFGGPVSFVAVTATGIVVTVVWNAVVPPIVSTIFEAIGAPNPYQRQRQLQPLQK